MLIGCAAHSPYKLSPNFEANKDRIKTIAVLPLYISDKSSFFGKEVEEQCVFGTKFRSMFFGSLKTIPLVRPIDFLSPEETIALFEKTGVTIVYEDTLTSNGDTIVCIKPPTPQELKPISGKAEALLFCDLQNYNEVGSVANATFLSFASMAEINLVEMQISLLDTRDGNTIWSYTPKFRGGSGGMAKDKIRTAFVLDILEGFRYYFPYSNYVIFQK